MNVEKKKKSRIDGRKTKKLDGVQGMRLRPKLTEGNKRCLGVEVRKQERVMRHLEGR